MTENVILSLKLFNKVTLAQKVSLQVFVRVCMYDSICSTEWEQTYQFSWGYSELAMPSVWQYAEEQEKRLL